jgi:crotonobetainyl-CoA:carnitine CoA-transferase CaiB-like acyl-CoA transferase
MTTVGPAVHFDETPLAAARPSPMLGEHTHAILTQAGLPDSDIEAMRQAGVIRGV